MKHGKPLNVLLTIFIILVVTPAIITPQTIERDKRIEIDRIFAHFNNDTPGAALAVVKDGKIVYKQGYGMANLEYDIPINPSSIFHVASITKQFADMCIVLLQQQGKLSFDDDIRKYIPEAPDFGDKITIRHLVHHISGLRDQWVLFSLSGWRASDVKTQEDVINFVSNQKELNFKPGDEYTYCNTGYTLLAEIVERVSGKSLREFADENIFKPLGMNNTHVHDDHLEIVKYRTFAYVPRRDGFRISIPVFDTYGATSLFTTVEDLAIWSDNFYHKKIGGETGIKQMLEKGKLNNGEELDYAFGLSHGNYKGLRTVGHGGSDAGYRAQFTMYPDQRTAIIVLSNVSNGNPNGLVRQVTDIVLEDFIVEPEPQPGRRPDRQAGTRDERRILSKEDYREYEGTYYSDELDVRFVLTFQDSVLVLQRKKFSDSSLRFREKDLFSFGRNSLNFYRDNQKKIGGFRLDAGRVRNLKFSKIK
jgi:CubicO group peptidase (beta-lactamase class C family)